jgi:phosphatidylserine synthase
MDGIEQRHASGAAQPSDGAPDMSTGSQIAAMALVIVVLVPVNMVLLRLITETLGWSAWVAVVVLTLLAVAAWRVRRSTREPWQLVVSFGALIVWLLAALDAVALATGVDEIAITWGAVAVVLSWHGIRYLRERRGGDPELDEGAVDHP